MSTFHHADDIWGTKAPYTHCAKWCHINSYAAISCNCRACMHCKRSNSANTRFQLSYHAMHKACNKAWVDLIKTVITDHYLNFLKPRINNSGIS